MDRIGKAVYCTYWEQTDKITTLCNDPYSPYSGMPVCPHCGSPLYDMGTEAEFHAFVAAYARFHGAPKDFQAFIEWSRGKCYKDISEALAAFQGAGAAS